MSQVLREQLLKKPGEDIGNKGKWTNGSRPGKGSRAVRSNDA